MATPRFKCKQCGSCCINLIAHAYKALPTDEDFRRWEEEGREDIQSSFEFVEDDNLIAHYSDIRTLNMILQFVPGFISYLTKTNIFALFKIQNRSTAGIILFPNGMQNQPGALDLHHKQDILVDNWGQSKIIYPYN